MSEPRRSKPLHLSVWLGGILACTLLVLVAPAGYLAKESLEARLVEQEAAQIALVQEDWRSQIEERLNNTAASALRLGRLLTLSLNAPRNGDDDGEFERLVGKTADGSLKSRPSLYRPREQAGMWIPPSYPVNEAERTLFLTAKRVIEAYQTRSAADFTDSWMLPVRGGEVIYWPDAPNFLTDLAADTDYTQTEWVTLVSPENNPAAAAKWTSTNFDPTAKTWMVSAIGPFYRDGKFGGSVGHDMTIDGFSKLMAKIALHEGTHAHFIRNDGTLLISSERQEEILASKGTLTIEKTGDEALARAFRLLKEKTPNRMIPLSDIKEDRIFMGAYLTGPDWYLVSTVPRASILKSVQSNNRTRLLVLLLGILAVLVLPVLAISRLLIPSLRRLEREVLLIRSGDLTVQFQAEHVLELDHVATALNTMVADLAASTEERERNLAALAESEQATRQMLDARTRDEKELRAQLDVIVEQQKTIQALSTPIIEVWKDVLALPVVGKFDAARAAQATEVLLNAIVASQARTAILDLTGVDGVDQSTAGHLVNLVLAVRLLGAEVIVTGLRPEIARGLIALGVDLSSITTRSTLREAIFAARKTTNPRSAGR